MLDTVPAAIGEAVEYARKDLTKDVSKFSKANQKVEKSETELGEFDDDRSSLPIKYEASHPSNNTGRVGQTTRKCGNAASGTGGGKSHKAQLEDKRWKEVTVKARSLHIKRTTPNSKQGTKCLLTHRWQHREMQSPM